MLTPEDLDAIKKIVEGVVKKEVKKECRRLEQKMNKKFDMVIDYFETRLARHHERLDRIELHIFKAS
ncbi:MAG: hypothetical protein M3Q44_04460 [bacterium]|nr:hypothetical protein [bacterium]